MGFFIAREIQVRNFGDKCLLIVMFIKSKSIELGSVISNCCIKTFLSYMLQWLAFSIWLFLMICVEL